MKKKGESFTVKARFRSFKHAFTGVIYFFKTEHNAFIHLVAAIAAITVGLWLSISRLDWIIIISMIGLVFTAELFNSAIEKIGDSITSEYSDNIKKAKDYAAAAVLITALAVAIVGLIIFIPRFIEKFGLIS
jgi:diacylglycerol kinase (ATP)